MEKHNDNILRNKLEGMEIAPPPEVWANINEAMQPRKKTILPFWRVAAGIAIASGILVGYFIFNKTENILDNNTVSQVAEQTVQVEKAEPTNNTKGLQKNIIPQIENKTKKQEKSLHKNRIDQKSSPKSAKGFSPASSNKSSVIIAVNDKQNIEKISPISSTEVTSDQTATNDVNSIEFQEATFGDKNDEEKRAETLNMLLADNSPIDVKANKWSVGGTFSPFMGGHSDSYTNNTPSKLSSLNSTQINQDELLAYSGGINVNFKLSKRLSMESGLHYSRMGRQINDIYRTTAPTESFSNVAPENVFYSESTGLLNAQANYDVLRPEEKLNSGYGDIHYAISDRGSEEIDGVLKQNVEYFEIPLMLKYKLIDKKIDFNLLGGISTNVLFGNKAFIKNGGSKTKLGTNADPDPVTYSSSFGFGLEYGITKNINLNLEPLIKYYLTPDKLPSFADDQVYRFGFYTGVYYIF